MSSRLLDFAAALLAGLRLGLSGGSSFRFRVKRVELFSAEERRLLDRDGALLEALASGRLAAWGPRQRHFVEAARDGCGAGNEQERVWLKYQKRLAFESDPENLHIHDEPVGSPDPDRSYYREKVSKGGKFFSRRKRR